MSKHSTTHSNNIWRG